MASVERKPSYDAGRRIRFLAAAIAIALIVYCAFWFVVAGQINARVAGAIDAQVEAGTTITCENRDVRGFPFRFGVFCDRAGATNADLRVSAGALRTAAQFYAPRTLIGELDGPALIEPSGNSAVTVDWASARFRSVMREPVPAAASVVLSEPTVRLEGLEQAVSAASAEMHMRRVEDVSVDLAVRVTTLALAQFPGMAPQAPEVSLDADIRLTDMVARLDAGRRDLRGLEGAISRVGLLLSEDRGVLVEGPFSIGDDGLLTGEFNVRVIDVDGVRATLAQAGPALAPLGMAFAFLPRGGETGDEARAILSVVNGQARFGMIPLGSIPALR